MSIFWALVVAIATAFGGFLVGQNNPHWLRNNKDKLEATATKLLAKAKILK